MADNYKRYRDCNIDELEQIVSDLENMSISALKHKKLDLEIGNFAEGGTPHSFVIG